MKLNGYPLNEVEYFYATCSFNERYAIETRAADQGIHPLEATANRMYAAAAKAAKQDAAREAREAQLGNADPITEATAKKVTQKLGRPLNKIKRGNLANIVGPADFQRIMNPQTRAATIAALTEGQGERIRAL